MKIISYVVSRDFGFAPNPFGGICTLATCKPRVRNSAQVGDWIIGTGGTELSDVTHKLIFVMLVTRKLTFDDYWKSPNFQFKKPIMNGSRKQIRGDNIYHRDEAGEWIQSYSHHSKEDGSVNQDNLERDTSRNAVLCSSLYFYFGNEAIEIPDRFFDSYDLSIHARRGHHVNFSCDFKQDFLSWFFGQVDERGYISDPVQFDTFDHYDGPRR